MPLGEQVDESELDDELAEMEQEQLDNKMLKTGTVPLGDEIHRLPAAANGERTYTSEEKVGVQRVMANDKTVKQKKPARQEEEDEEEELRKLQAEMAM